MRYRPSSSSTPAPSTGRPTSVQPSLNVAPVRRRRHRTRFGRGPYPDSRQRCQAPPPPEPRAATPAPPSDAARRATHHSPPRVDIGEKFPGRMMTAAPGWHEGLQPYHQQPPSRRRRYLLMTAGPSTAQVRVGGARYGRMQRYECWRRRRRLAWRAPNFPAPRHAGGVAHG